MSKTIILNVVVIILTLFTFLPTFIPYRFFALIAAIAAVFIAVAVFLDGRYITAYKEVVPIFFLLAVYCFNNYYLSIKSINFIIYIICLLFIVINIYGFVEWIDMFICLSFILGMLHAISTIILKFLPGIYLGIIAPLYPGTYTRLVEWYFSNCMPGLAEHYSTNGMYLVVGLFAAVAFGIRFCINKLYRLVIIGTFFVAILMTGKRAHLLFSIFALFILYYIYLSNQKKNRFVKILGILLCVAVVGMIIILYFPSLGTAFTRFQESIDDGDVTSHRINIWQVAISLFWENPLFGVGWGNFQNYYEIIRNYRAHAHNTYIQLFCETGIIGAGIYIGWFVVLLVKTIKTLINFRISNESTERVSHISFSLLMQVFFLVYCFTGNPLYEQQMYIPYFCACAITYYYYVNYKKRKE